MSHSNRMTLAQFGTLAAAEADALPVDQIALLLEDIAGSEDFIKAAKAKLNAALVRRYGAAAQRLRKSARKARGIVTMVDGDFTVKADLPKAVIWDQTKLSKLAEMIFHDWQLDPEDYIKITYTVEEQKYAAWPPDLRKHFDGARTLGAGKPSFEIVAAKRGVA